MKPNLPTANSQRSFYLVVFYATQEVTCRTYSLGMMWCGEYLFILIYATLVDKTAFFPETKRISLRGKTTALERSVAALGRHQHQ